MVRLQIWQKRAWLLAYKRRQKWQARHPNKTYPTLDPFPTSVGRYTCALCEERFYYYVAQMDKDAPQYHKHKKTWMVICHSCWHLKGIYLKHQDIHSPEGAVGCRYCSLRLAAKRAKKVSRLQVDTADRSESIYRNNGQGSLVASRPTLSKSGERDREGIAPTRTRRVRRKGVGI